MRQSKHMQLKALSQAYTITGDRMSHLLGYVPSDPSQKEPAKMANPTLGWEKNYTIQCRC